MNLILGGLKSIQRNWEEFKRRSTRKVSVPQNLTEHEFFSPEQLVTRMKRLTVSLHKDTLNIEDEIHDLNFLSIVNPLDPSTIEICIEKVQTDYLEDYAGSMLKRENSKGKEKKD